MYSTKQILTALALFALQVSSQTTEAATNPQAAPTGVPQGARLENLVSYLLPSASITSLSPTQSAAIISNAESYLTSYTQAHPISALYADIFLAQLGASTSPSPDQQSSLQSLVNNAPSAILADPSAFVASVSSIVSPFDFASNIYSYESGILGGLRTVVASDVGVTAPAASSSSSTGLAAPRATQGVTVGAVAIAAGLVGVGLL